MCSGGRKVFFSFSFPVCDDLLSSTIPGQVHEAPSSFRKRSADFRRHHLPGFTDVQQKKGLLDVTGNCTGPRDPGGFAALAGTRPGLGCLQEDLSFLLMRLQDGSSVNLWK